MEQYRVCFESMPWEQPVVGVRFKARVQDGHRLRLAEFTREFVEADWCTKGHIGYVLEGEMELDFHGRIETLRAGDGLFIPAGIEHGHKAKVLTESVTVVLVEDV